MGDIRNKLNIGNYVTVKVTNNPIVNGSNLLDAYREAKNINPNGQPKSASNRLSIILPPGNYDLNLQTLTLDTEFIDIIGSTTEREFHYIYSNIFLQNRGVIRQTANNVKIKNLKVKNTNTTFVVNLLASDPSTYLPASVSGTDYTEIENVIFDTNVGNSYSTALTTLNGNPQYNGKYTKVQTGERSFDYIGGSAILTNCKSTGNYSYGWKGVDGILIGCEAQNYSFGYGDLYTTTSFGVFRDCQGGTFCFGTNGFFYGEITNCTAGYYSFCSADGKFIDSEFGGVMTKCTCFGSYAFCSTSISTQVGVHVYQHYGLITNCVCYGERSFGCDFIINSSTFNNCLTSQGGSYNFCSRAVGNTPRLVDSKFINCTALGQFCFGYRNIMTINSFFLNCNTQENGFQANTAIQNSGVYINCFGMSQSFNI